MTEGFQGQGSPPAPEAVAPPMPVFVAPRVVRPPADPPARSSLLGYFFAVGIVAGVLVVAGLLALDLVGTGVPEDRLEVQRFPGLQFEVAHPVSWETKLDRVGSLDAVTYLDPKRTDARGSNRGFRVLLDNVSLGAAKKDISSLGPGSHPGYKRISLTEDRNVDGHAALRHVFDDGPLRYDQWFVQRGGDSFRIEFWAPIAMHDEAALEDSRILDTFRVIGPR